MQDICHVLKKLVNCLHYLNTRFIIMADAESVVDQAYTLNWGIILKIAAENEENFSTRIDKIQRVRANW